MKLHNTNAANLPPRPQLCLGVGLAGNRSIERSAMMREQLQGRANELDQFIAKLTHAQSQPNTNPGAWSAQRLRLGEAIARDLTTEVGEWFVLYTRAVPDPG